MAIQEGPFQNIVSISSQGKRYFVAHTSGRISIYGGNVLIQDKQTGYTFLDDEGSLRASFSNYYGTRCAFSVQFSNGSYGLAVFDEQLNIITTYNTGSDKVLMVGPCSINNDFICMVGNSVARMSLYSNLSVVSLASTVDIVIPDSELSPSVGADYASTETFDKRHIAPMPDGGFCYVKPIQIQGENGTFGDGPYVYRGFVAVYFSGLGSQGTSLYIKPPSFYWRSASGGHTLIDGTGAIRKQASGQKDIFINANKQYQSERNSIQFYLDLYAGSLSEDWRGDFIDSINIGDGKYFGQAIRSSPFSFTSSVRFAVGSFSSGLVEIASSEALAEFRFLNKKSFNQFQNPSKSNLVEFYLPREIIGTAYIYIGNVAKNNLSDFERYIAKSVGDFPEERVATASPGGVSL